MSNSVTFKASDGTIRRFNGLHEIAKSGANVSFEFQAIVDDSPQLVAPVSSIPPAVRKRKFDETQDAELAECDEEVDSYIPYLQHESLKRENSELKERIEKMVTAHRVQCDAMDRFQKVIRDQQKELNDLENPPKMQRMMNGGDQLVCTDADKERYMSDLRTFITHQFSCPICADLLYDSVTTNCKHTFCSNCIDEWKKRNNVCPECRTVISSESQSVLIDRFLDNVGHHLGGDFGHHRNSIRRERESLAAERRNAKNQFGFEMTTDEEDYQSSQSSQSDDFSADDLSSDETIAGIRP